MGWLIALGVFLLIAMLPVGALVRYDCQGFYLSIVAGFVRITLFPRKKKGKKEKKAKPTDQTQKAEKKAAPAQSKENSSGKGGSLKDFLPMVHVAMDFLNQFRKVLRVDHLQLKLILAGEDPCDLAVNYGRAWAALGNFLPMLERVVHVKKRDCEVECDFTAEQTLIIVQAELTLLLWQGVFLTAVYGFQVIKELLILKKKRKGGAVS